MASLREQKEAFVSGHSGTSLAEVTLLATAPVVLLLLWRLARHPAAASSGLFHAPRPTAAGLAFEFAVLVLPLVAALMGLISPAGLMGTAALLALALFATQHSEEWQQRRRSVRRRPLTEALRDSLSGYRASLMLVTLIAILGVDFPAFPRRYAKAETFGTGLMDAGVGSFVAASGLAHGLAAAARAAAASTSQRRFPWRRECSQAAALLALGLARLAATKAADYQSHASEYGTHWNFFLTLAALRLLSLALPGALGGGAAAEGAAGAALLAANQWGLSAWGLIDVVHSDERAGSWLRANKEGLLSLTGYWALQLLSATAGRLAYRWAAAAAAASAAAGRGSRASMGSGDSSSSFNGVSSNSQLHVRTKAPPPPLAPQLRLLWQLGGASAALWAAYWAAAQLQPVSRRACNGAYVLWMLALNVQTVAAFLAADLALPGATPFILSALNAAMLPVFLAGNLLTGLVNMAVNTLAASDAAARAIVAAYAAVLCGGAVAAAQRWPHK